MGTLGGVLADVASHFDLTREELAKRLILLVNAALAGNSSIRQGTRGARSAGHRVQVRAYIAFTNMTGVMWAR